MIHIGEKLDIPVYSGCAVMGSDIAKLRSFPLPTYIFPAGERSKTMETLEDLLDFMSERDMTREDYVYAIGGGVTGDLAGLAAALYMRGVKLIQVPTTLMSMVDSSIGGKTAVNLKSGKNLAGVFKQPEEIFIEVSALDTLPERIYNEGMAEVIKYSFICGEDLTVLPREEMIRRCVEIKQRIVESDEFDFGARRVLNFGHTIGHAIEKASGYSVLHGEAVAIGMAYITEMFKPELLPKLINMLERFNLPTSFEWNVDASHDKKRSADNITLAVPFGFGDIRLVTMPFEDFRCKLK